MLWRGSIIPANTQGVNFEEVARMRKTRKKMECIYVSIRIFQHILVVLFRQIQFMCFSFEIIFWEGCNIEPGQKIRYMINDYTRKISHRVMPIEFAQKYDAKKYSELLDECCKSILEPFEN